MEALSLGRRFSNAMQDTLDKVERNYYYYASKLVNPSEKPIPKAENAGPIRSNIVDATNTALHFGHDTAINTVIGFSPSPSETDLVKAGAEVLSNNAHRVPPLMSQFAKSPMALAGAAAVCCAALVCNPAVREEISHGFDKATQMVADAGSDLSNKVAEVITPSLPIEMAITPQYKPSNFG